MARPLIRHRRGLLPFPRRAHGNPPPLRNRKQGRHGPSPGPRWGRCDGCGSSPSAKSSADGRSAIREAETSPIAGLSRRSGVPIAPAIAGWPIAPRTPGRGEASMAKAPAPSGTRGGWPEGGEQRAWRNRRRSSWRSLAGARLRRRRVSLSPELGLRRLPDAGIEAVAGVEPRVVFDERRLGLVQVADIVLGGILGAARVEQRPHAMFEVERVLALAHDVILVEHVAEEVAVVK